MPRDISNQLSQAMQENHRVVYAVKIDFDTPLLAHSRFGELLLDGDTYYGVGAFGSISVRQEDTALNPQRLTIGLSGIPLRFIEEVTDGDYQNRDVYIYKALLNDSEALIGGSTTFIRWFRGVTANASIQEKAAGNLSVELEVSNWLAKWRRPANLRYNDKTQQELYPGDTIFQYLQDAQAGKVWRGV
jgi:hypothetical protein